jgi:hypothetical protein
MSGCLAMAVKSRKSRRLSPALKKQSSMVKKLASHYKRMGKKIEIGKLGKEAAAINRGEKSLPSSHKKSHSKKSRKGSKKTKRTTRRKTQRKGSKKSKKRSHRK